MCAIVGVKGENISRELYEMLTTLKHRGPDGSGVFIDGKLSYGDLNHPDSHVILNNRLRVPETSFGLGHNLLSIVGSEGLQPLKQDNMVLTCNGEIYNYRELKKDTEHDFQSDSDCEVIMALLKKFYNRSLFPSLVKTLKYLDGDYAFAVYDGKDLAVVRDPVGVKPVYFGEDKNKNMEAFASERKALWKIGIKEVKTLPPGHMLYNWKVIELENGLKSILSKKSKDGLKSGARTSSKDVSLKRDLENIDPNNIDKGNKESIITECRDALEHFAPFGGYFLKGGDDPPPTAPVENINYMFEAAIRYGKY